MSHWYITAICCVQRQKRQSHRHPPAPKNHKEERQVKREVRSGLFKQEQVLALSNCEPEEEEEVDILT